MTVPDAVAAMVVPPADLHDRDLAQPDALCGRPGVVHLVSAADGRADAAVSCWSAARSPACSSRSTTDVTALIWHPVIGQWTAFHLFGRAIPMLMPAGWCWNVGGGGVIAWLGFKSGWIGPKTIWPWFAGAVLLNMLFEVPGTSLGVYTYYGHQPLPLTVGRYSLAIAFGNGAAAPHHRAAGPCA